MSNYFSATIQNRNERVGLQFTFPFICNLFVCCIWKVHKFVKRITTTCNELTDDMLFRIWYFGFIAIYYCCEVLKFAVTDGHFPTIDNDDGHCLTQNLY